MLKKIKNGNADNFIFKVNGFPKIIPIPKIIIGNVFEKIFFYF